ncbi:MAG TPA: CDP-alcohol phosphatidyltransferase family protein [Gemmatirosa sp.]
MADALASKGRAVEEWVDLRFFRPIGMRLARALLPTAVSPDHVTLGCLVLGLAAGWCFVPASPAVNALGFVLFIASDLLDSADGQLARLRGSSTRFGRIVDGVSDNTRFINLYLSIFARLTVTDRWALWPALLLAVTAGVSHSYQSAAVDAVRNAYLEVAEDGEGEFELPEDTPPASGNPLLRLAQGGYAAYVKRQAMLLPATVRLVRRLRRLGDVPAAAGARATYAEREAPVVRQFAWLGQNIRFPLVAIPCIVGHPSAFLWLTLVPLNFVLAGALVAHEGRAARITAALDGAAATADDREPATASTAGAYARG